MSVYEVLTVITFVTSSITMIIAVVAVFPRMKDGVAIVRDAVLWIAMVVLVVAGLMAGWRNFGSGTQDSQDGQLEDEYANYEP